FETTGPAAMQRLAAHAAYLHRAPLLQLALAPPSGRPRTRLAAGGIALAWAAAVVWPFWDDDYSALALGAVFAGIAIAAYARASGRRARAVAGRGLAAAAVLTVPIATHAVAGIAGAAGAVTDATVVGYAAAVALAGAMLFGATLIDAPASLAERAVALERGATLRSALRDLLGDPGLEIVLAGDRGAPPDDRD